MSQLVCISEELSWPRHGCATGMLLDLFAKLLKGPAADGANAADGAADAADAADAAAPGGPGLRNYTPTFHFVFWIGACESVSNVEFFS